MSYKINLAPNFLIWMLQARDFSSQMGYKLSKKALSNGNEVFGFNLSSWGKIFLHLILRRELYLEFGLHM